MKGLIDIMHIIEKEILLLLCNENDNIEVDYTIHEIQELNWGFIIEQIYHHKLINYVARKKINKMHITEYCRIWSLILNNSRLNQIQTDYIYQKFLQWIIPIFNSYNINLVITKGVSTAPILYNSIYERSFSDVDFLVRKHDIRTIQNILHENLFVSGEYNPFIDGIDAYTKKQEKYYELVTHQIAQNVYKANEIPKGNVAVDINFGIDPQNKFKSEKFVENILKRKHNINVNNLNIPCMSKEDMFIHCCVHIHRDCTYIFKIDEINDVKLYQFIELYKMIKKWFPNFDINYIYKTIEEFDIYNEIFYALHFCSIVFPNISNDISEFSKKIQPHDITYLETFGAENNDMGTWNIPFLNRLFHNDRFSLIKSTLEQGDFDDYKKRKTILKKD